VLPDALEKHCIQAEPIVDKNGSVSKKRASAHLLLWICRRFSTDGLVLQAFKQLSLSVCNKSALDWQRSAISYQAPAGRWRFSSTGLGFATFFLKTKKRSSSVGVCSTATGHAMAGFWRTLVWRFAGPGFPREAASLY
jgi:hypothetical protein